jgi:2-polyprenyl-6-methoxyphenol hydroxylase-like FAD-dependent oxidoreductase
MTACAPRVIVIGAGLGGLCLAQGLRGAGFDVEVYERDPAPAARRQGYRLHIDTRGARGLYECLPPRLYELFLATCGAPSTQLTVVNKQLRQLKAIRLPSAQSDDPTVLSTSVDRLTLRSVLLTGLADTVRFGREFTRFDQRPDGTIAAHFQDGSTAVGDILVAADGVGSRVRAQYLPHAELQDLRSVSVVGKMLITPENKDSIPAVLDHGFTAVLGSRKIGMALGAVRFRTRPDLAAARLYPEAELPAAEDYVMWGLSGRQEAFPDDGRGLSELDGAALHRIAAEMITDWHPDLRALVERSVPEETFAAAIRAARPIPAWPATNVTLLGDAIHAMSPARGSGANIALMDAGKLTRRLIEQPADPIAAIQDYETEMTGYGFAAVRDSLAAARQGGGLVAILASALTRSRQNR